MKYCKLFNNFVPQRKCGAEILAAGITGGLGLFGTMASIDEQDNALTQNLRENEKNRQFNHNEAQLQRDWQSSEWDKQFEKQSEEWYKQNQFNQDLSYQYWLKEQNYSSPTEQIKRLNAAGLNANALFNDGNIGGLAPAASIPSAPSSISHSVPSAAAASISTSNPAVASSKADMIRSVGSFISDISKVYTENKKLQPEIDLLLANVKNQELISEGVRLDNAFKSVSFSSRADKAKNEMLASTIQLAILDNTKENISEDTLLKIQERHKAASEILLNELQSDKVSYEAALVLKNVMAFDKRLGMEMRIGESEVSRNNAAAYESTEAAKLHVKQQDFTQMETDLTSLKKVFQTLQNGIEANNFSSSTIGLEKAQLDYLIFSIEKAQKLEDLKNNFNLWNQIRRVKNLLGFDIGVNLGANVGASTKF